MKRPLIGLATYGRNERGRYELGAPYAECVYRAGGAPALLPPVGEGELAGYWLDHMDGLILTGGGDMDPRLCGEEAHATNYNIDPERDSAEMALAREALRRTKPALAICRGMQVLNVVMGGTLYAHIPDVFGDKVAHRLPPREPTTHSSHLVPGSRIARLLGASDVGGVSWHHQAIREMGKGLVATAHAADGVIEAAEVVDHPWFIAVQWHPEMSAAQDPLQQRLFDELVEVARQSP